MAENWGNDFLAAYMGGVKQRMAREQQAFEQKQALDRQPLELKKLQADIDLAEAHRDAMHAQIGAAAEEFKAKAREQFASGLRVAPSAIENPQMPGMISQQPMSAGDQLQQSGVDPRILAVLAAHHAINQPSQPGQQGPVNPAANWLQIHANQPDYASTAQAPTTFAPQTSYISQNYAQPATQDQTAQTLQRPTIPDQTQESNYLGTSAPSSTQFIKTDPRLFPGGVAEIEDVPSPEETDTRIMKQQLIAARAAGLKAKMEAEGKAPSEIKVAVAKEIVKGQQATETGLTLEAAKGKTQKEIEALKTQAASDLEDKKTKAAMAQTLMHVNAQIQAAVIGANAKKYVAEYNAAHKGTTSIDQEAVIDAAVQSATGNGQMPGYTNTGLAVKKALGKSGMIPFDPKDAEKLKAVNDVNVLYDTMAEHVNGMPEGKLGALVDRIASKIPGTDASLFHDSVFGKAANISHTYGGEIGRLSDPDVARAMGTLAVPGITKTEAINRLNTMKLESSSKVLDHILAGQSPKQQLMNLEGHGFDPEKFVVRGKNKQLFKKFEKNPQSGDWEVYDSKTSTYLPVNQK